MEGSVIGRRRRRGSRRNRRSRRCSSGGEWWRQWRSRRCRIRCVWTWSRGRNRSGPLSRRQDGTWRFVDSLKKRIGGRSLVAQDASGVLSRLSKGESNWGRRRRGGCSGGGRRRLWRRRGDGLPLRSGRSFFGFSGGGIWSQHDLPAMRTSHRFAPLLLRYAHPFAAERTGEGYRCHKAVWEE